MQNYLWFFLLSSCFLAGCDSNDRALSAPETTPETTKQPNFLLITTDDMGYTDLGAFGGHDIPTPNLDHLAMEGVRLTNFHVNVSCAPTRSMLMSGTTNHEAGMGSQQRFPAFIDQPGYERYITDRVATLPERLQAAGYHTYMAGKWHLGYELGKTTPHDRGFERSFALLPGGWDHFRIGPEEEKPSVGAAPVPYAEDGVYPEDIADDFYSTVAYVDKMISYLKSNEASDRPFFAWFAPTAPHWPLQVHPEWKDKFMGSYDDGYEVLCHNRVNGAQQAGVLAGFTDQIICPEKAERWQDLTEDERLLNRRTMELYAAMVAHMDQELGRLLHYLEQSGQLENTYIIYHNDNGPEGDEHFDHRSTLDRFDNSFENLGNRNSWVNLGQGWADATSAPYREEKGSQFSGGIKVPAFIRPPAPEQSGTISNTFLTVMDILPTILELANIEEADFPSTNPELLPIRGKSFAVLLQNESLRIHPANEYIALDHAGLSWLMEDGWKILRRVDSDEWQLYHTAEDPSELTNLASQEPQRLATLVGKYENHANAIGILRRY